MKHYTEKATVVERVVTATICDVCGKREEIPQPTTRSWHPEGWKSFSSGHLDWGNDSEDSWEDWDVCSPECYLRLLKRVVEDYGEQQCPTLHVDHFDYRFAKHLAQFALADEGETGDE